MLCRICISNFLSSIFLLSVMPRNVNVEIVIEKFEIVYEFKILTIQSTQTRIIQQ